MAIARDHAEWLSLLDISGPFLSLSVLADAFPQGLEAHDSSHMAVLRQAAREWGETAQPDAAIHQAWVRFVLGQTLSFPDELIAEGQALSSQVAVAVPEYGETLRPDLAILAPPGRPDAGTPCLLVQILPPGQDIEKALPGRHWNASPATRMVDLLHGSGVRLGLVTNGEQWMLVNAPLRDTSGFTSWYTQLWLEEPLTLRSFRTLLSMSRFFGASDTQTLSALLDRSATDQQEVTDQLGKQVRDAVQILIQAFDRIDKDSGRALLRGVNEKKLYESALTVMMRLVFLFAAEERSLLPSDQADREIYDAFYAVSTLRAQLRATADRSGEEILERRQDAWSRLLATFRAVYAGVRHDKLELPAYGGHLFDPDRFPFLEGRADKTTWRETPAEPLAIHNRTVLHLLEALQVLHMRMPGGGPLEARLLSFRALDIEQIGHVYEGLLDHTAKRASEPILGLDGSKDRQPEMALVELEKRRARDGNAGLVAYLVDETGRSTKALSRTLEPQLLDDGRLLVACDNDQTLCERVHPFAGLLREDTMGYPVVITTGGVYVTKGEDRRSTGTHYTPRSLTEPIVQYSLEPAVYHGPAEGKPREKWRLHPAARLLSLKVCDMAMGSGAFLVAACRYLADRLVEAWDESEREHPGSIIVTPEGQLATGTPAEALVPRDPAERVIVARRLVAERCLYGVDVNPMAVEMAKLSLWLVTVQKERPFTFLDHALRCGDSLLGLASLDQLLHWSLKREEARNKVVFEQQFKEALDYARARRHELIALEDASIEAVEAKGRLLAEADRAIDLLRLGADLLMATVLGERRDLLPELSVEMDAARQARLGGAPGAVPLTALARKEVAQGYAELRLQADTLLDNRRPFHWPLEFPEIFGGENAPDVNWDSVDAILATDFHPVRQGFDAIIGNPPFQGGQHITGALGTDYREYLLDTLANGKRGSADLCAYFFLRGYSLLRESGDLSLLATNTIAQGDTREVGLDQLLANGATILRAEPSRKWPGDANLEIAEIWLRHGGWQGNFVLSEKSVPGITAFLTPPGAVEGTPHRLKANESKSFQGSIVLGMGFVLEPEAALALLARDPRNCEVLFPYLSGEDLNSRPDQTPGRWVINFHDWSLEKAGSYADVLAIVREKVKPERDKNTFSKNAKEKWWQFERSRPDLYAAIAGMQRVLVSCRVTKFVSHSLAAGACVYDVGLNVFPNTATGFFCLLSGSIYDEWVREYSSTLETRVRYTLADCFETFPFPASTTDLDDIGERYYSHRQSIMLARQEGLTKTYNRFHDPKERDEEIATLRRLHVEMDQSVAVAYGWTNLDLGHGFHQTKQGLRYTISEPARREVLGRLLTLNHERYAEEVRQGLHEKGAKKVSSTSVPKGKRAQATEQQPPLFGLE
jgi:hypothetical protein